jgi:glucosylceramidase
MYMVGFEQAGLIQNYIGPALASAGLNTKVWAYDHNTGE